MKFSVGFQLYEPGEEPGNGGAFWWILVILAAWLLLGKRKKA